MKLKKLTLQNFRGYKDPISVCFSDFTAFVGKNDIGKSTILEAMDIFFNDGKGVIKIDKADVNIVAARENNVETCITAVFDDLPDRVIIDATHETSLIAEYLLNGDGMLEVVKKYNNAGAPKTYIRAKHPTSEHCRDLLSKKISELQRIVDTQHIECENRAISAALRSAIWSYYAEDLALDEVEIDVSKEDAKRIWDKLSQYLPMYSLFQSDRKNDDGDSEVQDPLKEAVKQILADPELLATLEHVAEEVTRKLTEVSTRTLEKLREMDPSIAESLTPSIPSTRALKWADVFKNVSITGDDIPINKRGSGVKRLILLNFFRAEAEKHAGENGTTNLIYAIEEPETSQHQSNQIALISALKTIAARGNAQIIITTHSSTVVKELAFDDLRLFSVNEAGIKTITNVQSGQMCYPSLNEINFTAFEAPTIEYLNELYGYLEYNAWMSEYKSQAPTRPYDKLDRHGVQVTQHISTAEYVRHQIHHPENHLNPPYTTQELYDSIVSLRTFIQSKV